jgi:hypothetical protein
MQLVSPPLRASDLVNSQSALAQWMEELISLDRLPLTQVQPRDWGYFLSLRGTDRFQSWCIKQSFVPHFLVLSSELDRYGNYLLLARRTEEGPMYGGLCHWLDLPRAAQELRQSIREGRECAAELFSSIIIKALELPEGSLNASPPNHCPMRWGTWLRIDRASSELVLNYLLLDESFPGDAPRSVSLGGDARVVVAATEEELRVGVTSYWQDHSALKDTERWLRGAAPRTRKLNKETTPN